jgi:hypothetical protein
MALVSTSIQRRRELRLTLCTDRLVSDEIIDRDSVRYQARTAYDHLFH